MNENELTGLHGDPETQLEDIVEYMIMSGNNPERAEKTRQICIDLWRKNPDNHNFVFMQGVSNFLEGRSKEAESWMEKAMAIAPQSTPIIYSYALMNLVQHKFAAASALMTRVVAIKPNHAKAYAYIGHALRKTGSLEGALEAFDKSLALNTQNAAALTGKGNTLKEMERLSEAADCYRQALALKPNNHLLINNLGVICFLQNDLDGADRLYREALTIQPAYPEALSNLSVIRRFKDDQEGAIDDCRKALALRPDYPSAFNNLGNALKDMRRHEEAVEAYSEALRLDPANADIHKNLAMALLALGRFDEGWREYHWRWKSKQFRHVPRNFTQPEWQGESGEGRTILIHAEQGFGDTLQFCRYAPLVKACGFHVVMMVPPLLQRLVQSLEGVDVVATHADEVPSFDYHCPMMHLPLALKTTVETIPARLPYLSPLPDNIGNWRDRFSGLANNGLKVGLVWAGRSRAQTPDLIITDRKRSISPETMAPLLDVENAQFFSLQKEGTKAPDHFHLIDWMADCHDFADTAALIMNLDLVVSVDTAVVHLAGALGKPVWLLNRFNSCWRWLVDRDDSPWYPGNLRIFNQEEMGDWDSVIERVRTALVERISTPQADSD